MKTQGEHKHKTNWGNIKVVTEDGILNFELDSHGRLKEKLGRQAARDLSIEMGKLPKKLINPNQSLTAGFQNTGIVLPSLQSSSADSTINYNYQIPQLINPEMNMGVISSPHLRSESNLNVQSLESSFSGDEQTRTNSPDSIFSDDLNDIFESDEMPFTINEYLNIEGVFDGFDMFSQLDENDVITDNNDIFNY